MKLLIVNTSAHRGSVARHVRDIAAEARRRGIDVTLATSDITLPGGLKINRRIDVLSHALMTRIFDRHGLCSRAATERFIHHIEVLKPDLIHLHNLHGYYLHYPTLFSYLRHRGVPVLWTLHDLWPVTGHCAFPDTFDCRLYVDGSCSHCPALKDYPASLLADRSHANIQDKKDAFSSMKNMHIIAVSQWIEARIEETFLGKYPSHVVGIDIDTSIFCPDNSVRPHRRVLGVANVWERRKNLDFFVRLRRELPEDVQVCIAGDVRSRLPEGVLSLGRAQTPEQMANIYRSAAVFINPTLGDNFPLTNREALCCGTPVVTRSRGGSAEGLIAPGVPCHAAESDDDLIMGVKSLLNSDISARHRAAEHGKKLFGTAQNMHRLFEIYQEISKA